MAFVATIYGVGLANIICLPAAGKLKIRYREEHRQKELMLEGVVAILEGMNPRMVELKLKTFLEEQGSIGSASSTGEHQRHEPEKPNTVMSITSDGWFLTPISSLSVRILRRDVRQFATGSHRKDKQAESSIRQAFQSMGVFPSDRSSQFEQCLVVAPRMPLPW